MTKTKEEIKEEIESELVDIEDYASSIDICIGDIRKLLEELEAIK